MSTLTTIQGSDLPKDSRVVINNNFDTLNTDKLETSVLDTDTSLSADSDAKVPTQKAVKAYTDAMGSTNPTGEIKLWPTAVAPTGYLICDGEAVSRVTYSDLFAVISTDYGVGDGSTTFNLPNLAGRVIAGAGTGTKVATFASRSSNVITVTGLSDKANNEFQTGQAVLYSAPSGAMTGLTHNTTYYVVRTGNLTFSLATSLANAQNGTVITLSSDGAGTQTFTITLTARALGETGGEENHAMSSTESLLHKHSMLVDNGAGSGNPILANTNAIPTATTITPPNVNSFGGNAAMNNMQPFITLNYIIKT